MDERDVLRGLRSALPGRTFALIGALARNAWAPPRATTDIDLTLTASREALESIEVALHTLGYVRVRQQQADPGETLPDIVVFRTKAGPQVDVLVAKTPFETEVLERAAAVEIAGELLPVATPEDLIVYKLIADRDRDRDDIRAVVRTQLRAARGIDWTYVGLWATRWGIADRLEHLKRALGLRDE